MVRFRFGCETSSTRVLIAPKGSVRAADRWSLVERVAGLASRAIGIWTLRFAFGRGAGPPELPTTRFAIAVGMPKTSRLSRHAALCQPVDRTRPKEFSAIFAVRSDAASELRGTFDVLSLSFRARTNGGFRARDFGTDVAADNNSSWSRPTGGLSGTRLSRIRRFGYDAAS